MKNFSKYYFLFVFLLIMTPTTELIADEIKINTLNISEKAKALLKKEQRDWCNPIEEGVNTFSLESNPVTSVVLGMDGEEAEIVEYNKFRCKVGWGRSGGGSGGYPLALIIDDVIYDLNLVRGGWNMVNLEGSLPVLLLSRHGTFCNLSGTYACLQAFVYHNKVLSTPLDWMCGASDKVSCSKDIETMKGLEILKVVID